MTDRREFRRWVRELRTRWPSLYPVRVLLVPPSKVPHGDHGACIGTSADDDRPTRFTIYVADNQSRTQTADTLAEEWSHVLRMHIWSFGAESHDAIYGAIFNELKREWLHGGDEKQPA